MAVFLQIRRNEINRPAQNWHYISVAKGLIEKEMQIIRNTQIKKIEVRCKAIVFAKHPSVELIIILDSFKSSAKCNQNKISFV